MTEEYYDLFFGKRVFSERIRKRIIIIHNRLERQRENLKKKQRSESEQYVLPDQKRLFECENQKDN